MPYKTQEERNIYARKYHREHKEMVHTKQHKYYAENKSIFLSRIKEYQMNIPEQRQVWAQKYGDGVKTDVLTHYGNGVLACVQCGFTDLRALTIDHINNDGAKHRRDASISGGKIYRWLVKNGYPEGFQTLCMNCQFIKQQERWRLCSKQAGVK